ncbi:hypothetical protein TURU_144499 [Turdus rufiventris]|nr:hypothetical protein TURU_144499 [Turdus rufiventris]
MWQEAMMMRRRRRYLLERAEQAGGGCGASGEQSRSRDWLYESYYCMSQQHPLIVFLLLIVMGACLALIAVFFASGLLATGWVSGERGGAHPSFQLTDKSNFRQRESLPIRTSSHRMLDKILWSPAQNFT